MKNSLFHVSSVYSGHRYFLSSKLNTIEVKFAASTCALYGGYLVEINSYNEMKFLKNFLSAYPDYTLVLTGGNDEGIEGHWFNRYSGTSMAYLNWAGGEPNEGRGANCLYLWRERSMQMCDNACYLTSTSFNLGYLCKIPA
ncbi:perlucin-like protein [Physella acuta]|uniref:perlucin-like protein n=1 Tax=Physella acuta TaxID=109671 RepID=UPI0027DE89B4|nr:perlucin-like protein [Physella acuta]